jgi:2Fe-2S ferredoxin
MHATLVVESRVGADFEAPVPEGCSLLDACDGPVDPIPFCCRSAGCGTCRVQIIDGVTELTPAAEDETDVLCLYNLAPPEFRLACQARVAAPNATVRVRVLGP